MNKIHDMKSGLLNEVATKRSKARAESETSINQSIRPI